MKLLALIDDTVRSRFTTVVVYVALATFFLLIGLIAALFIDPQSLVQPPGTAPTDQGGVRIDLSTLGGIIDLFLVGLGGFVQFAAILLSVFATAGVLPSSLEKGTVDLFLSKPLSRGELLLGRFLGAISIVFAITAYFVLGAWLIISIKTGYWNAGFLAIAGTVTLSFAILYAVMAVLGIATRSSAATIIIVFFYIYIVAPLLAGRETSLYLVIESGAVRGILDTVYYVLPKPGQIGEIAAMLIMGQAADWMPLWSSALFGAAMYALAWILLRRKDF